MHTRSIRGSGRSLLHSCCTGDRAMIGQGLLIFVLYDHRVACAALGSTGSIQFAAGSHLRRQQDAREGRVCPFLRSMISPPIRCDLGARYLSTRRTNRVVTISEHAGAVIQSYMPGSRLNAAICWPGGGSRCTGDV